MPTLFSLFSSIQEHLLLSWVPFKIPFVRQDEQFQGLSAFDVGMRRQQYTGMQCYNTALANYSSGSILTSKAKAHFLNEQEAKCPLCAGDGGPTHLIVGCPGTLALRQQRAFDTLLSFPNAVRVSGLFPTCPEMPLLRKGLDAIQPPHPYVFGEHVHLFTDGSTSHGSRPSFAVQLVRGTG